MKELKNSKLSGGYDSTNIYELHVIAHHCSYKAQQKVAFIPYCTGKCEVHSLIACLRIFAFQELRITSNLL